MRFIKVVLAGVVVLFATLAAVAPAAETVESVVKKVDAKLYYPQLQGLRSLEADVTSSYLQERLQQAPPEAQKARLKFYWAAPYQQAFRVTGVPEAFREQVREVERQLSMWGERVMPKPVALTLAGYKCKLTENETSFVIDARTTQPTALIWSMKYTIDKKSLLPTQWYFSTNDFDADVAIKYEGLPTGQFYPKHLTAQAEGTKVTLDKTHKVVGQYLLVESLTIKFVGSDGSEQTSTLKLSNFKFNQPIPPGTFPQQR